MSFLKWIIQICSKFYCWVSKIAFHSPNPHCCMHGETVPLIRIIIANLTVSNYDNFDALDLSECLSEEVIRFF